MYESVKAGKVISMESKDTISDGSAGGLEEGSITFELCRELGDEYVLVSEDEIKKAKYIFYLVLLSFLKRRECKHLINVYLNFIRKVL